MPPAAMAAIKSNKGKNLNILRSTQPLQPGQVMLVKFGKPLDELTVQVMLLLNYLNIRYCTLCKGLKLCTNN